MTKIDKTQIDKCKLAINKLFLKPFKYIQGDCIKKNCIDPKIYELIRKVADHYNIKYSNDNDDLVKKLTEYLECNYLTISCLLEKIRNSSDKLDIDTDLLNKQISQLKQPGPFDSKEWFSNINIDDTLEQFEDLFKDKNFLHIYFHMRDFKKSNSNPDEKKNLNKIKFSEYYKKGIRCFGVVFNTDVSTGGGEHWFAIFGDFSKNPFTIEHFNSSGDNPLPEISDLMSSIKHEMLKYCFDKKSISNNDNKTYNIAGSSPYNGDDSDNINDDDTMIKCINATRIVNQKDNHSCGSYSLFYILCRLCDISCTVFENNAIGDNLMHEFRRHLFAHNY